MSPDEQFANLARAAQALTENQIMLCNTLSEVLQGQRELMAVMQEIRQTLRGAIEVRDREMVVLHDLVQHSDYKLNALINAVDGKDE